MTPAALYGSSVALPRLGMVKCMRRDAARAFGLVRARSITARLAVNRCDLALLVVQKPVATWAQAIWDRKVPRATMQASWLHASRTSVASTNPSVAAGGAAGAFIAAIQRIGWSSPTCEHVKTLDGTVIDLTQIALYTQMQYLREDFGIVTAADTSLAERLTQPCTTPDSDNLYPYARSVTST